jgi:NCS1 family nucleobase:cation symporter-1
MIADYYVCRKRRLNLKALYSADGEYRYWRGINPAAVAAFVVAALPSLPGFLANVNWVDTKWMPHVLLGLYNYAWFVGFGLGFVVYIALQRLALRPRTA